MTPSFRRPSFPLVALLGVLFGTTGLSARRMAGIEGDALVVVAGRTQSFTVVFTDVHFFAKGGHPKADAGDQPRSSGWGNATVALPAIKDTATDVGVAAK